MKSKKEYDPFENGDFLFLIIGINVALQITLFNLPAIFGFLTAMVVTWGAYE